MNLKVMKKSSKCQKATFKVPQRVSLYVNSCANGYTERCSHHEHHISTRYPYSLLLPLGLGSRTRWTCPERWKNAKYLSIISGWCRIISVQHRVWANSRPCAAFYSVLRVPRRGGEGGLVGRPVVRPLIELELHRKITYYS